ncbi:hypothetical protein SAMN05216276_10152 [Streptosporangium subroseum]|uniref:Uncharacterized protein n=1 Tax=Streptosporangium subroseum TaxID=106412 RepID=A0A239GXI1_9ACTN|nr:hypothetical protein SAMN05216276_10152 [Streptosporangium subroseum]
MDVRLVGLPDGDRPAGPHRRTAPLVPPVASSVPPAVNARATTVSNSAGSGHKRPWDGPPEAFHRSTPNWWKPVATQDPAYAMDRTPSRLPPKGLSTTASSRRSTRALLRPPMTRAPPSGRKAMARSPSPGRMRSRVWLATSHNSAGPSSGEAAGTRPSGLNTRPSTESPSARRMVPAEARRPTSHNVSPPGVGRAGRQPSAVRAEGQHGRDGSAAQRAERPPAVDVPQRQPAVAFDGGDPRARPNAAPSAARAAFSGRRSCPRSRVTTEPRPVR